MSRWGLIFVMTAITCVSPSALAAVPRHAEVNPEPARSVPTRIRVFVDGSGQVRAVYRGRRPHTDDAGCVSSRSLRASIEDALAIWQRAGVRISGHAARRIACNPLRIRHLMRVRHAGRPTIRQAITVAAVSRRKCGVSPVFVGSLGLPGLRLYTNVQVRYCFKGRRVTRIEGKCWGGRDRTMITYSYGTCDGRYLGGAQYSGTTMWTMLSTPFFTVTLDGPTVTAVPIRGQRRYWYG